LKLLEGTVANVPPQGGRKHPEQQYIQLDTSQILFICGGTFVGLEDIIRRRIGKTRIGFASTGSDAADVAQAREDEKEQLLRQVTNEDIVEFGLIPELVGRLPIVTPLMPLDVDALVQILTEPKNALVKQYQQLFGLERAKLTFTDGALRAIAARAADGETGARALRAVMEDVMLELMYELPDLDNDGAEYVVNEDAVHNRRNLADLRVKRANTA